MSAMDVRGCPCRWQMGWLYGQVSVEQLRRVVADSMENSKQFLCDECGESFTNNQNRLRHVRTVHQGKKRTDNEKRKREVTDKAGKQGILAYTYSGICEDSVESNAQMALKSPSEYVRMVDVRRGCPRMSVQMADGLAVWSGIS